MKKYIDKLMSWLLLLLFLQDYILHMSLQEVHDYIKNLMIALRRVHMFDIIHRDVKPSNFLCDRKTKR
jgi:cell division control protein 7